MIKAAASEISVSGYSFKGEDTALQKKFNEDDKGGVCDSMKATEVHRMATAERSSMENNSIDPSTQKNQEDRIKSAKEEVGEVREENERLKLILAKIKKEYQSLQIQFSEIVQHEEAQKSEEEEEEETDHLVSLSLGRLSTTESKKDDKKTSFLSSKGKDDDKINEGLALGLECKFESAPTEHMMNGSPEISSQEHKEKDPSTETWPPNCKMLKMARSRDEDVLEQNPLKKARVSIRARCDTPTMNDGCQWRKYGQKIAKGNPCPRAYYRCTVSPSCPVRKQVQRCAEDMSILITTYEGTHNHPLPVSATAMASTTSAAASMLRSGSSTSQPGMEAFAAASSTSTFPGLNFAIPQNSRSQQFYFPNSSFSTSNSHPTITIDLTAPPASHFNRLSSSFPSAPRYPATCLNFSSSSSSSSSPLDPGSLPTSWGTLPAYGALSSYNKNQIGPFNFGRHPPSQENIYQPYMQKAPFQQPLSDTIATATKAIAADPAFRSALAAAISSFVGNAGGAGGLENQVIKGENPSHNMKWGEFLSVNPGLTSSHNGVGCASSYLNRSSSANPQQQGSLISYPPSFPFSVPNSASASPSDNKDNIK